MKTLHRNQANINLVASPLASNQNSVPTHQQTSSLSRRPVVICGPSGSGKSTLLKRLLVEHKERFTFTVSHTTRKPRKGEVDGRDYHFVTHDEMHKLIEANEFIEHTQFSNNYYGTSKGAVREALSGKAEQLILEVDIEGVKALAAFKDIAPMFVFVRPPCKQSLINRLTKRNTESLETLKLRLDRADKELAFAESGLVRFDLILVNDDLETTYRRLRQFLKLNDN